MRCIFLLAITLITVSAHANEPGVIRAVLAAGWKPTPAALDVSLARVYFSEADGRSRADERLIYNVLVRRGGSSRLHLNVVREYSKRATGTMPPLSDRQAWIQQLDAQGTRPIAWPHSAGLWTRVSARWLATLERARQDLRTPPASPCSYDVDHWGGEMDDHRALANGWVRGECGTLNRGWCDPDTSRCS